MLDLLNIVVKNTLKGEHTNLAFIDLSKGFDTISHNILIQKLKILGLDNKVIIWL